MKAPSLVPLTHAYWLKGKHMVLTQSAPDPAGNVNCSWLDGKLYRMRPLPVRELMPLPPGLTDEQRAKYVLANLPRDEA